MRSLSTLQRLRSRYVECGSPSTPLSYYSKTTGSLPLYARALPGACSATSLGLAFPSPIVLVLCQDFVDPFCLANNSYLRVAVDTGVGLDDDNFSERNNPSSRTLRWGTSASDDHWGTFARLQVSTASKT